MTLHDKLILIDEYLAEERVNPQWRDMIKEYRSILTTKDTGYKWINAMLELPVINRQVLCATLYSDEGKFKRDFCVGSYDGWNWNCACKGDIVTHWQEIEEINLEA